MVEQTMRIGWIGVGRMGYQLASWLLGAGYDVAVYSRTRAKVEPLAEKRGRSWIARPTWPTVTWSSVWFRHTKILRPS